MDVCGQQRVWAILEGREAGVNVDCPAAGSCEIRRVRAVSASSSRDPFFSFLAILNYISDCVYVCDIVRDPDVDLVGG